MCSRWRKAAGTRRSNGIPADEIRKVKAIFPTCTKFDREFVSVAFYIATGCWHNPLIGCLHCVPLYAKRDLKISLFLAPNSPFTTNH
jgi:hypothetical protein